MLSESMKNRKRVMPVQPPAAAAPFLPPNRRTGPRRPRPRLPRPPACPRRARSAVGAAPRLDLGIEHVLGRPEDVDLVLADQLLEVLRIVVVALPLIGRRHRLGGIAQDRLMLLGQRVEL